MQSSLRGRTTTPEREELGWAVLADPKTHAALDARDMAPAARKAESVIHPSDPGSQYRTSALGNRREDASAGPPTGSVGEAYGNERMVVFQLIEALESIGPPFDPALPLGDRTRKRHGTS